PSVMSNAAIANTPANARAPNEILCMADSYKTPRCPPGGRADDIYVGPSIRDFEPGNTRTQMRRRARPAPTRCDWPVRVTRRVWECTRAVDPRRGAHRRPADMGGWLLVANAEEPPLPGHAFEFVFAFVEEIDVGTCNEIGDGS